MPCIISWPAGIEKGIVTEELIQNTDFVPTWLELAGAKVPEDYKMDGLSLAPLFKDQNTPIRDYVFNEMGASRAVKTKDWSYMTLRYTTDQVEEMRKSEKAIARMLTKEREENLDMTCSCTDHYAAHASRGRFKEKRYSVVRKREVVRGRGEWPS